MTKKIVKVQKKLDEVNMKLYILLIKLVVYNMDNYKFFSSERRYSELKVSRETFVHKLNGFPFFCLFASIYTNKFATEIQVYSRPSTQHHKNIVYMSSLR